jgi:hypothetical protein
MVAGSIPVGGTVSKKAIKKSLRNNPIKKSIRLIKEKRAKINLKEQNVII